MAYTKKNKGNSKRGKKTNAESEEDKKNFILTKLADFFTQPKNERFSFQAYLHNDKVPMLAKSLSTGKDYQGGNQAILDDAQFAKVKIFATFKNITDLFVKHKDELRTENFPEGFDPTSPIKGIKSDGFVLTPNIQHKLWFKNKDGEPYAKTVSDKVFNEEMKKAREKGMSAEQIYKEVGFVKKGIPNRVPVWTLYHFKDVLPKSVIDKHPEFSIQEEMAKVKMSEDGVNEFYKHKTEMLQKAFEEDGLTFVEADVSCAYYSPSEDAIYRPPRDKFVSDADYFSVTSHECIHATGAKHRLNRDLSGGFGSLSYSFEELKAESGAMFFSMQHGLDHFSQHAPYLAGWAKDNFDRLLDAQSDAQKAVDYLNNLCDGYKLKYGVGIDDVLDIPVYDVDVLLADTIDKPDVIFDSIVDDIKNKAQITFDVENFDEQERLQALIKQEFNYSIEARKLTNQVVIGCDIDSSIKSPSIKIYTAENRNGVELSKSHAVQLIHYIETNRQDPANDDVKNRKRNTQKLTA